MKATGRPKGVTVKYDLKGSSQKQAAQIEELLVYFCNFLLQPQFTQRDSSIS